ncbi:MAG TPA: Hsp70 family protein [Polyangiaceae bacterium]
MSGAHVGIDLGTTYSLVAVVVDGEPRVLPNAVGEFLTPSAVHVGDDGAVLVGSAARARAATHPEQTALAFKRDMGTDRKISLGGRVFTPEELSALVLGELKRDAEAALGEPIAEAVVTVPAYFGELQRRATRDACELAGLRVERIINEPTAAALAYGLHHRDRELRAAVVDLGGGTFDVTVLEIMEGVIEIQASSGDTRLGGEDFVDLIAEHCAGALRRQHGVEVEAKLGRARLREAAELAKRRLSREERTLLAVPALPTSKGPLDVELSLERTELEDLFQPLIARMSAPIARALRDAGKEPRHIDEVILVGGATRMPCIGRLAAQIFGRLPQRSLPPDEAVALGAAVQAALKAGNAAVSDLVATDVAPFSLGIASAQSVGDAVVNGIFSPIIERGTVLPASRVERFVTMGDGQKQLNVVVYQGEHPHCSKNRKIGEYELKGIPPRRAGEEAVDVRFTYDMNGVLDVDATIVSTQKTATFTIERTPGRLSKSELEAARKKLSHLKFHPREALPNVTALARADALYAELVGPSRARLGSRIAGFRAALETQNPAFISEQRQALQALLLELSDAQSPTF